MKFKATIITTVIYEPNTEHYGTSDVQEMLRIDRDTLEEDPFFYERLGEAHTEAIVEEVYE